MNAAYGVMINDENLFYKNFADNVLPMRTVGIYDPPSATAGLNNILHEMDECGYEVGILIHQDVELPPLWLTTVEAELKKLPENWLVAGVWGLKMEPEDDRSPSYYGRIIDSRVARKIGSSLPVTIYNGPLPQRVDALDEVCLIVNLKHGFRFSKVMHGFDLYGTYICLWAKANGHTAWAIDARFTHRTTRSWAWRPDKVFMNNWEWLCKQFPDQRVLSTVYY